MLFRSLPLTRAALLHGLTAESRISLSAQAADVVEARWDGLPGPWCELAVQLRQDCHELAAASRLLATAGRRALAGGELGPAAALLTRAWHLLPATAEASVCAEVLDPLISALSETGQIGRAVKLAASVDELGGRLRRETLSGLRATVGWAACAAGWWAVAAAQVSAARVVSGPDPPGREDARIDALAAWLAARAPDGQDAEQARRMATRAMTAAGLGRAPVATCQAALLLGELARGEDVAEATRWFRQAHTIAAEHGLPVWKLRAQAQAGLDHWLATADAVDLRRTRREALRSGASVLSFDLHGLLALHQGLRGNYGTAGQLLGHCRAEVAGLGLKENARQIAAVSAVLAAHQGRRGEMDRHLAELRGLDGERSGVWPLALGLGRAVCALLEEDRALAHREIAQAVTREAVTPCGYPLAGGYGLRLLLDVLSGEASWPHYQRVTGARPSELRWNRQFVLAARAVLLGRDGRKAEAMEAMSQASQAATPFTMARHLVARLSAEPAAADGWGEPVAWLRHAEEYFHGAGVPLVAGACRSALRRLGGIALQHRAADSLVPRALRELGVTRREYEVLQLLADRPTNKAVARKLYISPRTVEKHVASLILKVGQPDRSGLCEIAMTLRGFPAARSPESAALPVGERPVRAVGEDQWAGVAHRRAPLRAAEQQRVIGGVNGPVHAADGRG